MVDVRSKVVTYGMIVCMYRDSGNLSKTQFRCLYTNLIMNFSSTVFFSL